MYVSQAADKQTQSDFWGMKTDAQMQNGRKVSATEQRNPNNDGVIKSKVLKVSEMVQNAMKNTLKTTPMHSVISLRLLICQEGAESRIDNVIIGF